MCCADGLAAMMRMDYEYLISTKIIATNNKKKMKQFQFKISFGVNIFF